MAVPKVTNLITCDFRYFGESFTIRAVGLLNDINMGTCEDQCFSRQLAFVVYH